MKRTPLRREGKKGRAKRMSRKAAREWYFGHFGDSLFGGTQAPCQLCRMPMDKDDHREMHVPTAAHKRGRGVGGSDDLSNFVIAHWACHSFIDNGVREKRRERMFVLEKSSADVRNGKFVEMPEEMLEDLRMFRYTGHDH